MNLHRFHSRRVGAVIALLLLISIGGCDRSPSTKIPLPGSSILSPKLTKLFEHPKLLCFGRYALSVPAEATLVWGSVSFPSEIESFQGDAKEMMERVETDLAKLKDNDDTFELTLNGPGPVADSWQLRYYENSSAKRFKLHTFVTYVHRGDRVFIFRSSTDSKTPEAAAEAEQLRLARGLRLQAEGDVPHEPGYCIEHAFIASADYGDQEMVNVGLYMPSLPDVTFSISSNKDAYADYSKNEFEQMKKDELSVLSRIHRAQQRQGLNYPPRTLLREGKRAVQHWDGEESLIRRPDGVHDFEWGFVGTPTVVATPSELIVKMYTKVEHNVVGAANSSSLNDEEAVALWDRLLSQFKFRSQVPGAPQGSYVYPSNGNGGNPVNK